MVDNLGSFGRFKEHQYHRERVGARAVSSRPHCSVVGFQAQGWLCSGVCVAVGYACICLHYTCVLVFMCYLYVYLHVCVFVCVSSFGLTEMKE